MKTWNQQPYIPYVRTAFLFFRTSSFVFLVERVGNLVRNLDSYKYELFVFATPCAFQPFLRVWAVS